jgi:hypothetical protein
LKPYQEAIEAYMGMLFKAIYGIKPFQEELDSLD